MYRVIYAKTQPMTMAPIADKDTAISKAKQLEAVGYDVSVYEYLPDGSCRAEPVYATGKRERKS